ncbi:hypothetical protein SAMN04488543_2616 [Friedmanniella luteola]|uniref:Uncharacterized protein n=1 Tax=Friedmanniella luteola TaxID=546871 RepID=A0A1H1W248_9ACTN|nr:hypothetical protein [Friedmanniella luteola]SDS90586.1 hypothetical protein SAMN04488543_2616 [Friedmanniella luteola]
MTTVEASPTVLSRTAARAGTSGVVVGARSVARGARTPRSSAW